MRYNTATKIDKTCNVSPSTINLDSAKQNMPYIIVAFKNCSQRQRLSNIGLGIGTTLEVISNIYGKPLVVYARGARLAISRKLASEILVRHEKN